MSTIPKAKRYSYHNVKRGEWSHALEVLNTTPSYSYHLDTKQIPDGWDEYTVSFLAYALNINLQTMIRIAKRQHLPLQIRRGRRKGYVSSFGHCLFDWVLGKAPSYLISRVYKRSIREVEERIAVLGIDVDPDIFSEDFMFTIDRETETVTKERQSITGC